MNDAQIYAELTPIFRDVFDDDTVTPMPAMAAADVDGWDSLGHIRLVVAVEAHFGIKFTAFEINDWATVDAFVQSIKKHLAAHGK